jgi:uncharacterized protein YndB with AHSA1/START domain
MSDVVIEREFKQAPDIVFAFLTQVENLLKWWGPEGITVPSHDLSLGEIGPWFSEMKGSKGEIFKVSGDVKSVVPPEYIEFTWAWHDDNDARGHESQVRFEVTPSPNGGSTFKVIHTNLADDESAKNHMGGWTSSINRLENALG